ncbi:conserved hypothetical protein [Burkholderiales bacterium 8X]|nr:conserved hypothetical protein [Burkholderiales bacterium 8X]
MDKEVDPTVLAFIDEKRLLGEKRTPVEIISRLGVFDAREKAAASAWLATGDIVIATIWAEFVSVGQGGRWFYLESLNSALRIGGGERTALQSQRAEDRHKLLKQSLDAGRGFRAVLQTNRVAILDIENSKSAKVSTRVPDDEEWHVASWEPDLQLAVLVRGERGWQPTDADMQAARARAGLPDSRLGASGAATTDELHAAAMAHLHRHFTGYGYKVEDVSARQLGYDLEVSDKKGALLLQLAVKGTAPGTGFELTQAERDASARPGPWRLGVVSDALGATPQHKIYPPAEIEKVPGFKP